MMDITVGSVMWGMIAVWSIPFVIIAGVMLRDYGSRGARRARAFREALMAAEAECYMYQTTLKSAYEASGLPAIAQQDTPSQAQMRASLQKIESTMDGLVGTVEEIREDYRVTHRGRISKEQLGVILPSLLEVKTVISKCRATVEKMNWEFKYGKDFLTKFRQDVDSYQRWAELLQDILPETEQDTLAGISASLRELELRSRVEGVSQDALVNELTFLRFALSKSEKSFSQTI